MMAKPTTGEKYFATPHRINVRGADDTVTIDLKGPKWECKVVLPARELMGCLDLHEYLVTAAKAVGFTRPKMVAASITQLVAEMVWSEKL